MTEDSARPWEELRTTGLLWLINAAVLHPRGFALAVVRHEGQLVGWKLLGDGTEPWRFSDDFDEPFAAVEAFLDVHRPRPTLLLETTADLTDTDAEELKQRFLAAQPAQVKVHTGRCANCDHATRSHHEDYGEGKPGCHMPECLCPMTPSEIRGTA